MRQVSKKQTKKNAVLHKIKQGLPKVCHFCGKYGNDLAHLLPKSRFPKYYTEEWNLIISCREHHHIYDESGEYRRRQTDLYNLVMANVDDDDKGLAMSYFDMI
ncbi:HNH endonuclease [Petrimonas sulfuriphila]|uniref:HNH endonuclease n=1 Tax=Petrimonas sulfuriphila TaxID=285070 RepID=UPI003EB7CEE1